MTFLMHNQDPCAKSEFYISVLEFNMISFIKTLIAVTIAIFGAE